LALLDLAERRGLKLETLEMAEIVEVTEGQRAGWFEVPYANATGYWKSRYSNPVPGKHPKMLDEKGATFHLYNPLRLGPGEDEVWFAEGEYDTLTLIEQGLKAIGIHGVTNVGSEDKDGKIKEGRFRASWRALFTGTVYVMFDNDDDGWKHGNMLARILEGETFDRWDDRYEDPNEWHQNDPDGLRNALMDYRWME
jgi:hypothetical protein